MFCKKCGKEITDDTVFCKYCGAAQRSEKSKKQTGKTNGKGLKIAAIILMAFAGVALVSCAADMIFGLGNYSDGVQAADFIKPAIVTVLFGGVGGVLMLLYRKKNSN